MLEVGYPVIEEWSTIGVFVTSNIQLPTSNYKFCFFISSTIYSLALMLNARIVQVIFLSAWETNCPPSTQNRFLQSCAWLHLFNADLLGSFPIRTVPASWMISPGFESPQLFFSSSSPPQVMMAPILCITSLKVSFMCLAWFISCSLHFTLNFKTGMPNLSTMFGSISQ